MSNPFSKIDEKTARLEREIQIAEEELFVCMENGRGIADAELALEQAELDLSRHLYSDPQDDSLTEATP